MSVWQRLRRVVALDLRSLALARVAIAVLVLADLANRAVDLRAHYTDIGVLPRQSFRLVDWDSFWSLHMLSGSAAFEATLFVIAALFALALLLGYRTFPAQVGTWLLTISLHARNPLVRDGQDDLLRVLLFWTLFLPLGAVGSLDHRGHRSSHPFEANFERCSDSVTSIPALCFLAQGCIVYWASAIAKLQSGLWNTGDGLFYALSIARYETLTGMWLRRFPAVCKGMTVAVMAWEGLAPFAFWLPRRTGRLRLALVSGFLALHLGMAVCLRLGSFPYVAMALWLCFLPGSFWDARGVRLDGPRTAGTSPRVEAAGSWVAVLSLLLVVPLTIQSLAEQRIPVWINRTAQALGLQQWWSVFAPNPVTAWVMRDAWIRRVALLQDGRQIDLFTEGPVVDWLRPAQVSRTVANTRWRHLHAGLLTGWPRRSRQAATVDAAREHYISWLCDEWNEHHAPPAQAARVTLYQVSQRLGHPEDMPSVQILDQASCPGVASLDLHAPTGLSASPVK